MFIVGRWLAGTLSLAYVLVVLRGPLAHLLGTGHAGVLLHSLTQPWTLLSVLVGLVAAVGLWAGYAWGWWLALVAGTVQLIRVGGGWVHGWRGGHGPSTGTVLIVVVLVTLLATLLATRTRRQCTR